MIDLHSHILPNIDDGSRCIEESLMMIKEARESGFTSIICTAHYLSNVYGYTKLQRQRLINELQEKILEHNLDIKLYNGAEVYVTMDIDTLIKDNIVPTLNNSKYVLIELPMGSKVIYIDSVIDKLFNMGLIPVLAHPERYTYMQSDFKMYEYLISRGLLFQGNFGSVIGKYGRGPQKAIMKLLKKDMIHVLATDAHRHQSRYTQMDEILKKLRKKMSEDKINVLTKINPERILKDEEVIR